MEQTEYRIGCSAQHFGGKRTLPLSVYRVSRISSFKLLDGPYGYGIIVTAAAIAGRPGVEGLGVKKREVSLNRGDHNEVQAEK